MKEFKALLKEIKGYKTKMFGKDLLLTWEKTTDELKQILAIADLLKLMRENNISAKVFDSGLAVSLFRDNSTRTRFSFASACNLLGLAVQDLDEGKSQIAHGETVRETANMISFLSEVVGIRDDMYLGAGNTYMREVGEALDDGFKQKVLPQRPAVVNLQCDIDHPTQSMADLGWLKEHFGGLENLKGKKIAMTWAYSPSYGKPLSVPQGIIGLMTRFGMDVVLAHPPEFRLMPEIVEQAKVEAKKAGVGFDIVEDMSEGFKDADVVYAKSWGPLVHTSDAKEGETITRKYADWITDEKKMKLAKSDAIYMHPLPADRNVEVTDAVIDGGQSVVYDEAENRLHAQKAVMALTM